VALEKTSVTDLMEMVWKTVPCSMSSIREAALSELGSAPRLGEVVTSIQLNKKYNT